MSALFASQFTAEVTIRVEVKLKTCDDGEVLLLMSDKDSAI